VTSKSFVVEMKGRKKKRAREKGRKERRKIYT